MDFIYQYAGWGTRVLELALAAVFLVHGWSKVRHPAGIAVIWGGNKTLASFHGWIEIVAALMVVTEFGTFYGSLIMAVIMLGAMYYKIFKWKTPFMATTTTGWEFDLVIFAGALTLLLG
jgi:putative oxidoreductase